MIFRIYQPVDIILIRKIHATLTSPTAQFRQAIATEIGTDADTVREALASYVRHIEIPKVRLSDPPPYLGDVPVFHEGSYAHKKLYGFKLGVWACQATTWRDAVYNCARVLYLEHEDVFEKRVMRIKGQDRVYFSRNPQDLKEARQISSGGLYVETNLSANNSFSLICQMAKAFEYEPPEIITEMIW
jgi:hypothetical protein